MSTQHSILVIDDEPSMLRFMRTLLEADSYHVETASNGPEAINKIRCSPRPDVVLLDLMMPNTDGLATLKQLRRLQPDLNVIILSCLSDPQKAVQAIRLGARDYITKPFAKETLDHAIESCLRLMQPVPAADSQPVSIPLSHDMSFLAASPAMLELHQNIERVARVDVPVLLLGESGTGKEVAARLLHKLSTRAHGPFLKINCAAMPGELLESELFGYEAGAFTGASTAKPGKFELCQGGIILLDEIGEMPVALQAKLLHVLQDNEFSRLGGRANIRVDVRVLAATNIDVSQAIAERKLRPDLYYRLNAFTLALPPLRDRREEIPFLLRHFMNVLADQYAQPVLPLSPVLVEACLNHPWPGNLRELVNFVKRYLILGNEEDMIRELEEHKESYFHPQDPLSPTTPTNDLKKIARDSKRRAEREIIAQTLARVNWNRRKAAEQLSISYKALLYKIRQFDIRRPSNGSGPARRPNRSRMAL